ncbi:unnamed protein product [Larinioides sclopetarius]|uniref:RING-type domain-containing protein n=1 Tax=Larinioides sclopetarius TaxID=280406 RepID=A0AAV2BJL6_9ARAC
MNGNSYPKNRHFEFTPRRTMNITQRWYSRIHLNNRYSNFGWNEFRRQSKTWKTWLRKPGSQAATSSFGARQPFNPKPPVNLVITIPNFSGAHAPDLFVFRDSSAKSVKFASAPASDLPESSCFSANKDVESNRLISYGTETDDDDVQYLYTVQTRGGEHVEFVDLSEDSEFQSSNCADNFGASDHHFSSNNTTSSDVEECSNDRIILEIPKETDPSSEKQNAAYRRGYKRKKPCEDLLCDICEREYWFVRSRGQEIFKARCGHMFCQQCLKGLDPYKCPECNIYLQKLFKVFL